MNRLLALARDHSVWRTVGSK